MKHKTRQLAARARNSLVLGIELFNRPHDEGRTEAVLLLLDHAFEMLLKAVIFERTNRIRALREKCNYGFEKCVDVCRTQLTVIDADEAMLLKNLNGFRDAAQHDVVEISEGLLFSHAQSAVMLFAGLLNTALGQDLAEALPVRILPLSTQLPTDIQTVIATDLAEVAKLLEPGRRQAAEAEGKLRPYQIMEANLRAVHGGGTVPAPEKLVERLRKDDWRIVLPRVAGLVQTGADGIPITIHVSKKDGFPVRIDPDAPHSIAFRYANPEQRYPFLTRELGETLGANQHQVVNLARLFGLKGNQDYHQEIRTSRSGSVHRYSQRALNVMRNAIADQGMEALMVAASGSVQLDPAAFDAPAGHQAGLLPEANGATVKT